MNKINGLFRQMDEAIFEQIGLIKSSPKYQELIGKLDFLGHAQSKAVLQIISYALILLPIPFVLVMLSKNSDLKRELKIKRGISQVVQRDRANKLTIAGLEKALVSERPLASKENFLQNVTRTLGNTGPTIRNFESRNISATVVKSVATLAFDNLSGSSLFKLLSHLSSRQKIRFKRIDIKRNDQNNTLGGTLELVQFSKDTR